MRECSKRLIQQGHNHLVGGAYGGVCEHGQEVTCLRQASPAKAGNAAGDLFQHSHLVRPLGMF